MSAITAGTAIIIAAAAVFLVIGFLFGVLDPASSPVSVTKFFFGLWLLTAGAFLISLAGYLIGHAMKSI